MGWRFQRRKQLFPGVRLNVSKRGVGASIGPRGARVSVGRRGVVATATLVGTGLSYIWRRKRSSR